jgi:hypothetical protein
MAKYPKVIDDLTDVIKELNQPCGKAVAHVLPEQSAEARRAGAVGELEQLEGESAAAAAEHSANAARYWRLIAR